jgi:HlyD family secretion protein
MRLAITLIVVVGIVAGGAAYYATYVSANPTVNFRTTEVKRDNLTYTISATGTVEPEEVVDIGAQVMGRVKDFGLDPSDPEGKKRIDYRSVVHEGTVLAYIDDSTYKAQLDQANAAYLRSQADVKQMQAKLLQSEQDRKRAESLRSIKDIPGTDRPIKGIADSDYDLAVANHEVAKANVAVGQATVKQTAAALELAKTNLDYTIIKSPVEGEIIARRVNIGQTVVASLNAPSIFLIGKDLRRMQVWASVNEADIGKIMSRKDMPVRFTVDAFQGEVFRGKVLQVRLNANMTQNVVLYTVVVAFDNSDKKLIPYLTANLQFEVEEHQDVLTVPTAALRWKPKVEQVVPELRESLSSTLESRPGGGQGGGGGQRGGQGDRQDDGQRGGQRGGQSDAPSPRAERSDKPEQKRDVSGRLWVKDGKFVRPIDVQIGATDGTQTEVSGDGIKEGLKVVMGVSQADKVADSDETKNPFAPPSFPRGQRPR